MVSVILSQAFVLLLFICGRREEHEDVLSVFIHTSGVKTCDVEDLELRHQNVNKSDQ